MVDLEFRRRRWSARPLLTYAICVSTALAQPVAIAPRWQVRFPATAPGIEAESTAVPVGTGPTLLVVAGSGTDPLNPTLRAGNREIPVKVIGHDPVSRLGFLKVEGSELPKPLAWSDQVGQDSTASLRTMEAGGSFKCQASGWVKQVGGKILPFALLRVNFGRAVPPPGTPLLNEAGRVVAIVFQSTGSGDSGYAIPAEVMHRVHRDIANGGKLKRGWLGLALRAESPLPQICRLLPDSPAAAAGIKVDDVILSIGTRQVADYADAANAFFYLIPGQAVQVKLRRNKEHLVFTLVPTQPVEP
jgi:hypothetical protein